MFMNEYLTNAINFLSKNPSYYLLILICVVFVLVSVFVFKKNKRADKKDIPEKNNTPESTSAQLDTAEQRLEHEFIYSDSKKTMAESVSTGIDTNEDILDDLTERKHINDGILSSESEVKLDPEWQELIDLAYFKVHSILHCCIQNNIPMPKVGLEFQNEQSEVIGIFELAWPKNKVAVALDDQDKKLGKMEGWKVFLADELMEKDSEFLHCFVSKDVTINN